MGHNINQIQSVILKYFENPSFNKLKNTQEMDKFLEA